MILKASVTIATWKRKYLLEKLINILLDQSIPTDQYEVIVCDSGSNDGTQEMMADFCKQADNVHYINDVPNILASKRNYGIRKAAAPVVIFLDDDVIPERNFIAAHLASHEGRTGVVICGDVRFPEEWVRKSNYFRFRNSRHIGPGRPDIDPSDIPFMNVVVMNLSFKKSEILEKVGFVSEEFRGYGCEDSEFGYRIWKSGLRIEFNEKALVYHYEHEGSIDGFIKKIYHTSRDGTPVLLRLAPESINYTLANLLEPITKTDNLPTKVKKRVLRLLMNKKLFAAVKYFLNSTDHFPLFYSPYLFRYLSACAYLLGVGDRHNVIDKQLPIEGGWFS